MRVLLKCLLPVLLILSMIASSGCRIKEEDNIPLEILEIFPTEVVSHTSILLNVTGKGFNENSVIFFNSQPVDTDYVTDRVLKAKIDASRTAFSLDFLKVEVPVWVINKDPSSGGILAESSHFTVTVWPMPEFSDPKSIYLVPPEVELISNFQLMVDENNRFLLVWREVTGLWGVDASYVKKLCISRDGGETWENPREIPDSKTLFSRDNQLLAFPYNEAMADGWLKYYYSADNGTTWATRMIRQLRSNQEFDGYQVCLDGTGRFILVYGQTNKYDRVRLTTLHSSDLGQTWDLKGENFTPLYPKDSSYVYDYRLNWMVVNDTGGVLLGVMYKNIIPVVVSRVYKSTDGGETFEELHSGLSERNIHWLSGYLTPQGTLYALCEDNYSYRVHNLAFFRGSGFGEQTEKLFIFHTEYGGSSDPWANIVMDTEGNMYVFWNASIYRSIDGGDQWTSPLTTIFPCLGDSSPAFDNRQNLHIAYACDKKIHLISSK